MVRVIRSDADQGDFDREFWARQTPPQRLEDVAELERAPD